MKELKELFQKIKISPKEESLFLTALTHKSFSNESGKEHNERLEFLGDAVLELAVTESLFLQFPTLPEGDLTSLRSALVRRESLADIAKDIDLGSFLKLSRGEETAKGREKSYILANTVEALIGAIFLDQGFDKSKDFIKNFILIKVDKIYKEKSHIGPKTAFQEFAQEEYSITPHYKLLQHEGPDHEKIFTMGAFLKADKVGEGYGSSKQKAESDAAKNALKNFQEKLIKN